MTHMPAPQGDNLAIHAPSLSCRGTPELAPPIRGITSCLAKVPHQHLTHFVDFKAESTTTIEVIRKPGERGGICFPDALHPCAGEGNHAVCQ